jgi:hypothetical protein
MAGKEPGLCEPYHGFLQDCAEKKQYAEACEEKMRWQGKGEKGRAGKIAGK